MLVIVLAKELRIQALLAYGGDRGRPGKDNEPFELFLPNPSLLTTSSAHRIPLRGRVSALNLNVPTWRGNWPCNGCGVVSNCVVLPVGAGTAGPLVAVMVEVLW